MSATVGPRPGDWTLASLLFVLLVVAAYAPTLSRRNFGGCDLLVYHLPAIGRARPGKVRVLEREPEKLSIASDAPDPTWLFVLRGFWPYRTVLVDGRPADVVPAQLAFTAVAVPPGRHRIEWREDLPGIADSRWGPVFFVVLAGGLMFRDARRRRPGSQIGREGS